jgi:hypothetical protein
MQLIALAGRARVGKNTAALFLDEKYGFRQYAFAGPLKAMLHAGLGLDPRDFETTQQKEALIEWLGCSYRHAAQTLGTEWMRDCVNPNGWIITAERAVQRFAELGYAGVVINDMRFENEATWVRAVGGHVVHMKGARAGSGMSAKALSHASERGLEIGPKDLVLDNGGTIAELHENIDRLVVALALAAEAR